MNDQADILGAILDALDDGADVEYGALVNRIRMGGLHVNEPQIREALGRLVDDGLITRGIVNYYKKA